MESVENAQEQAARKRALKVLAGSGASAELFGEPRAYALEWDGPSLPEDKEVEEGGSTSPIHQAL